MDWRNLPPLSALRAFAAFSEEGSVQKAGAALNVSHAAISQHLRKLEDFTGLALIDRTGRQARLTGDGRALAQTLSASFAEIASQLDHLTRRAQERPLHVTTTPSFAANWLVPRLVTFREAHPGIDVTVDADPNVRAFRDGGADVAIRFGHGDWPGVAARLLIKTRRVAVAAPDFLRKGRPAEIEDLSDYPVLQEIGTSETTGWLKRHGVREAGRAGRLVLPGSTTLDAARAGQGILVTSSLWVEADLAAGRLEELFSESHESMGYYLIARPGPPSKVLEAFMHWAQTAARREARPR